jgi:hypothetical protein
MNFLFNIIIFLLVLFLYIHITHQLKTSEDLEIYELDYTTNQHLQEVCDIKQPVLFEFKVSCTACIALCCMWAKPSPSGKYIADGFA